MDSGSCCSSQDDVAGGEQDNDLAQWRRLIRMNAVDILQPDLCYIGGFTRAGRRETGTEGANSSCRIRPICRW